MARPSSRALPNQGNKNGPWRTVESSLCRATDWELPPGIHGPNYFLERGRNHAGTESPGSTPALRQLEGQGSKSWGFSDGFWIRGCPLRIGAIPDCQSV